jgi:hypothetical protein
MLNQDKIFLSNIGTITARYGLLCMPAGDSFNKVAGEVKMYRVCSSARPAKEDTSGVVG